MTEAEIMVCFQKRAVQMVALNDQHRTALGHVAEFMGGMLHEATLDPAADVEHIAKLAGLYMRFLSARSFYLCQAETMKSLCDLMGRPRPSEEKKDD